MPYPNDDYISVEEQLRRQQMQQLAMAQEQPYAEIGDIGNIENIDTQLAQQMGSADYAELLRSGAAVQKGATTTRYNPMLDYAKGHFGQEPPAYEYASGQRPGQLALQAGVGGVGAGLAGMAARYGVSRGIEAGRDYSNRQAELQTLQNTDWLSKGVTDPQFGNFTAMTPAGQIPAHLSSYYNIGAGGQPFMNVSGLQETLRMQGYSAAEAAEQISRLRESGNLGTGGLGGPGLEQAGKTPTPTGPGTGGPSAAHVGAGMAAGALTTYLINRYVKAPEGVGSIAGGMVGGGVAGGLGGLGASGASASMGGAAAGSAGAIAGGAIMGGAGAVIAHVASKIIGKHVFGVGKESGKDVGARQLYESYHGKWASKAAKSAGFEDKQSMLAQPYAWMTQEARDFRGKNPDYDYSAAGTRGKGLTYRSYQAPEYKPTKWEAWVGGMLDSGYKMTNILDATAYYSSEKGSDRRKDATKAFNRGKDWYMDPANDPIRQVEGKQAWYGRHGQMDRYDELKAQALQDRANRAKGVGMEGWTDADREARWQKVQAQYEEKRLPWEGEGFEKAYQEEYGHMKDAPDMSRYRGKKGMKKFHKDHGKKSWYERHGKMDKYYEKLAKYAGMGPMAGVNTGGAIRPQMPTTAKVGDRFARMGVTQSTHLDKRDLYGQGKRSEAATLGGEIPYTFQLSGKQASEGYSSGGSYAIDKATGKKKMWGVTGNTGGGGGNDIMGWVPYEEEMEYSGNTAEGS